MHCWLDDNPSVLNDNEREHYGLLGNEDFQTRLASIARRSHGQGGISRQPACIQARDRWLDTQLSAGGHVVLRERFQGPQQRDAVRIPEV